MLRFLADENFNHAIVRALLRTDPELDVVTVQDMGLANAADPVVLEVAASQRRLLLTHDVRTIPRFVLARIAAGQPMPGVVEVPAVCPLSRVVEDLLRLARCSKDDEWENQIVRIPL